MCIRDRSESNLNEAQFNLAIFSDGTIGANLSNTQGTGANLSSWGGINLEGVNLTGVNLSTLGNFSVSQTTIFSDGVVGANLANASPSGAMANDVDLRGVNLMNAHLGSEYFDLTSAKFDRTTIFSNAETGLGVNLAGTNANLSNMDLSNVDFRGANLTGCLLYTSPSPRDS